MRLFDNISIGTRSLIGPLISGLVILGMLALLSVSYANLLRADNTANLARDVLRDGRAIAIDATTATPVCSGRSASNPRAAIRS